MNLCQLSLIEGKVLLFNQASKHEFNFDVTLLFHVKRKGHAVWHVKYFYSQFAYSDYLSYTVLSNYQTGFIKCLRLSKNIVN